MTLLFDAQPERERLVVAMSGGVDSAVVAALRVAERLTEDDVLVVLLPDGGRGYLNKIFNDAWSDIEPGARDLELSKHQIVILASIVEKETAAPEERRLIAAVFLNRLKKGMRLETDPTVIYGIPNFDGNLRRRDLQDKSNPYNTYQIAGLPPGPIASPGSDALRAVVKPAETEYLYFVSRNDGTHEFSRTYREHVNAVNRYQRRGRRSSE